MWERFGDYLMELVMGIGDEPKVLMREENDPDRFMDIVVTAVQQERVRTQQIREKRTDVREHLLKKLFGKQ